MLSLKSSFLAVIKNSSLLHGLKYDFSRKEEFEKDYVSEKLLSDNSLSISEALETDIASWLSS